MSKVGLVNKFLFCCGVVFHNLNAADAAGGPMQGGFMALVPFALMFIAIYFLMIRPQQKQAKEKTEMISSTRKGDKILTSGGIIGVVQKVYDNGEIEVKIAEEAVVRVLQTHIIVNYTTNAAKEALKAQTIASNKKTSKYIANQNAEKEDSNKIIKS